MKLTSIHCASLLSLFILSGCETHPVDTGQFSAKSVDRNYNAVEVVADSGELDAVTIESNSESVVAYQGDESQEGYGQYEKYEVQESDQNGELPEGVVSIEESDPMTLAKEVESVEKEEERYLLKPLKPQFHELNFGFNQSTLSEVSMEVLNQIAELTEQYPTAKIVINGHADKQGDAAYNLQLSQKRAESVAQGLIQYGVPMESVLVRAYGDKEASDDHASSRKVELTIMSADEYAAIEGDVKM